MKIHIEMWYDGNDDDGKWIVSIEGESSDTKIVTDDYDEAHEYGESLAVEMDVEFVVKD